MEMGFYFYCACCLLIIFPKALTAIYTISPSESLTDAMTLVSNDGTFVLSFFSPGTSKNRYLGIWFNIPMQTVVWVANRINPINDSTVLLKIETSGRIVLQVQNTTAVWSTNTTASVQNPVLQLLDSGNLPVRYGNDNNPENYLWQSFDYPADTMLPGMKIGFDLRTGLDRRLTAWKNWDDPSPGDLCYGVELKGSPEMVLRKGLDKISLSGLWAGTGFSGAPTYRKRVTNLHMEPRNSILAAVTSLANRLL
ncbi:S-locus-specific glycoprotein S13-like [Hibiscus syriacus]|uniref:S-locus-specific glycoprotein S13-like n=1 Tax=Hibiscus syriacus TaxID=106335 RepID=UPI001922B57C|nr:S-locus-specific glycoprotein S13-like [Hibiscus syriacus]